MKAAKYKEIELLCDKFKQIEIISRIILPDND